MSEKEEFVKFFQKYGVDHSPHDDPGGIMVGQSVFEFRLGRFTGVRWDELGKVDKRIERVSEKLIDELIDECTWVASDTGLTFGYQEDLWNQVPVSLQKAIDEIFLQKAKDVFQIVVHAGFNPERWKNELATDDALLSLEAEFEGFIKRAERNRSFGNRTMKEYMKMVVQEDLAEKGLLHAH